MIVHIAMKLHYYCMMFNIVILKYCNDCILSNDGMYILMVHGTF